MHIILEPLPHIIINSACERRCIIRRIDHNGNKNKSELWFQFDKSITPPQDNDCDAYLLAVIMDAMKEGSNIEVKGSVSINLLSNLVEYQAVWNKWLPDTYNQIDIVCDHIRENEKKHQEQYWLFPAVLMGHFPHGDIHNPNAVIDHKR